MMQDSEGDEPVFHVRYIEDGLMKSKGGYWEKYDLFKKTWFRLCDECSRKVCKSSESLCIFHYNKENKLKKKAILKSVDARKNTKRLNNVIRRKNKKGEFSLESVINTKVWTQDL